MDYPKTYRYTKDDEWIEAKGQVGTIGLTGESQLHLPGLTGTVLRAREDIQHYSWPGDPIRLDIGVCDTGDAAVT